MRTLEEIEQHFPASSRNGLSREEVARSRERFGDNHLTPLPSNPLWKKFLAGFDEPIIRVLLAACLLALLVELLRPPLEAARHITASVAVCAIVAVVAVVWFSRQGSWVPAVQFFAALLLCAVGLATGHLSYDGLAVLTAIVLAVGGAFLTEHQSEREFELLQAQREALRVKVLRSGEFHTVALEEIVVGDRVILDRGDEVPADGWLIEGTHLEIDQALLSGESKPVRKQPWQPAEPRKGFEAPACLYRGTQVFDGLGALLVAEIGDATSFGQIARRLTVLDEYQPADGNTQAGRARRKLTLSRELTPLQHKLKKLAGQISTVGYLAAGAIFLALLARGVLAGEVRGPGPGEATGAALWHSAGFVLHYFVYMVIIIVVAVPEGLPMSVTISLALAMRKMSRANCLVRQLAACETLGSTTVICSDKTGTLTQNRMQVVRLSWEGEVIDRAAPGWVWPTIPPTPSKPIDWIALNAAVNSTANLELKEAGSAVLPVGNSTEGALLLWLHEAGIDYRQLREQFPPLDRLPFSPEKKRMCTAIRCGDHQVVLVKGAPERLLDQCNRYHASDGDVRPLTSALAEAIREQLRRTAALAMRPLAFGSKLILPDLPADELLRAEETAARDLVWAGFIAIRDPLRDDVKEAVAECRQAGIEVKMITGDHLETARVIAAEVGLLDEPDVLVLGSDELESLSDDALKEKLPRLRVLARARPLDKLRLVCLLQEMSEVVAVTGDGANDAPALKHADVGLAMGASGTPVAREASKIVLLDDAFSTIVKAIHWGRALYENIQRFLQFQLTINLSALAIVFLGPFLGVRPPFTILQLLWINVIMDTLASIALCSEPPRPGLLQRVPRKRNENILTPAMLWTIATTALFFIVVMLALLLGMKGTAEQPGCFAGPGARAGECPELTVRQVSIFFTVYVLFQVWNEINCRSLSPEESGLFGLTRNPTFLTIIGVIVAGQVLIVTFGGTVFQVEPLHLLDWLAIVASTASVLLFAEVARRIRMALR